MNNLRFTLYAVALFALAYVGVSWGVSSGVSSVARDLPTARAAPTKPPAPAVVVPPMAEAVEPDAAKPATRQEAALASPAAREIVHPAPVEVPKTPVQTAPRDLDTGRGQLELTAIRSAEAYAQAPCEAANKAAFIVAVSTYLRASSEQVAPIEPRLRNVIQAAFRAGGIRQDEFPAGAQPRLAGFNTRTNAEPRCAAHKQVDNLR